MMIREFKDPKVQEFVSMLVAILETNKNCLFALQAIRDVSTDPMAQMIATETIRSGWEILEKHAEFIIKYDPAEIFKGE